VTVNLSFSSFNINHTSLYIVQGLESSSLYHVIQAVEDAAGKRKFLLFIPKGYLNLSVRNWEDWLGCKKASFEESSAESNNEGRVTEVLQFCFDVDEMTCKTEHGVIGAKHEKEVQSAVENKEMFIFDEEFLKVNESVFPLKFKKEKTKGLGFREIRNSIDINTCHLLTQKTEKVKTKFLANPVDQFLTKVQVVNRPGKTNDKKQDGKAADVFAVKEKAAVAASKKRSVDKSTVEEKVHTSKRGRVVKKRF
jgi:hypothetical protein